MPCWNTPALRWTKSAAAEKLYIHPVCVFMDGQPPTECTCGSTNFERIVIARRSRLPYRTEFIACAECRVMYFVPEPLEPEPVAAVVTWSLPKPPG